MTLRERIGKLGVGTIVAFLLVILLLTVFFILGNKKSDDYLECRAEYVAINGDRDCQASQETGQDQYLQQTESQAQ